ncbi:hypothetical protein CCP4SC76_7840004 [Gammaproteobacteria bacterium]
MSVLLDMALRLSSIRGQDPVDGELQGQSSPCQERWSRVVKGLSRLSLKPLSLPDLDLPLQKTNTKTTV